MSEVINKHSRMPRKLSRRTLKRREEQAIAGIGRATLAEANPMGIVDRYLQGERIRELAKEYGVKPISIYSFLLAHVPEQWMAAQKARAFARKEEGEDELDDSKNAIDVAIAREKLRGGQWDLERVDRKNYGRDDPNVTIHVVDLGDRLLRARQRIQEFESKTTNALASNNTRAPERIEERVIDAELVQETPKERAA